MVSRCIFHAVGSIISNDGIVEVENVLGSVNSSLVIAGNLTGSQRLLEDANFGHGSIEGIGTEAQKVKVLIHPKYPLSITVPGGIIHGQRLGTNLAAINVELNHGFRYDHAHMDGYASLHTAGHTQCITMPTAISLKTRRIHDFHSPFAAPIANVEGILRGCSVADGFHQRIQ